MTRRLYTFDVVVSIRKSIEHRLGERLEKSRAQLQSVRVARENYEASIVKVLWAKDKAEKDRAVSDCLIYLRGLRREMAVIRETLDEAETSLMSHSDFETLLFTLEQEAGENEEGKGLSFIPKDHARELLDKGTPVEMPPQPPPGPVAMKIDAQGHPYGLDRGGNDHSEHSPHPQIPADESAYDASIIPQHGNPEEDHASRRQGE